MMQLIYISINYNISLLRNQRELENFMMQLYLNPLPKAEKDTGNTIVDLDDLFKTNCMFTKDLRFRS